MPTVKVKGMSCQHCVASVTKALSDIEGITDVSVNLEAGEATLSDQIRARSSVADAAVALLSANGEVITALESLAATIGLGPQETFQLIEGEP